MQARLIKDCTHINSSLFEGTVVDCDMQPIIGKSMWDKNYKVYLSKNDFEGCIVPCNCVECLDEDYLRLKKKVEAEKRERQIRFINTWMNVVVNRGPRGGVKEIMFNSGESKQVNTIGRTKSKYYLSLLDELGVRYSEVKIKS